MGEQFPTYKAPRTAAQRQNACGTSPCPYIGYKNAPGASGNLKLRNESAQE